MNLKPKFRLTAVGAALALALATSGCLASDDGGGDTGGEGGTGLGSDDGDKVVTILGAFGGAEEEAFNSSLAAFSEESGIDIQYTSDQDFTTTIKARVNSGDAPDIGLFPQPGGLMEFAADGKAAALDDVIDLGAIEETLVPGFLESTTLDGTVYGAPMRMAVKSIVWYPKANWGNNPTEFASVQELQDLATTVADSGTTPWCMGWGSDQATGWVGTDWIEEYVLRIHGPEVYDQWVAHEIPFNDPKIVEAFDEYAKIAKDPKMVLGGAKGIINTPFGDTMASAFSKDPQCLMMRQGNFITGFFPENVQDDLDNQVGTFVFPPYEGGYDGQPMLGGGDLAAAFNDNDDDTNAVMEFLTSDQFGSEWAAAGGWLSPHTTFDASNYPDETTRGIAELATSADVFRFDASDLMPKEVGSGTFWTEMVKWVDGQSSQDTADAIEASWPSS